MIFGHLHFLWLRKHTAISVQASCSPDHIVLFFNMALGCILTRPSGRQYQRQATHQPPRQLLQSNVSQKENSGCS